MKKAAIATIFMFFILIAFTSCMNRAEETEVKEETKKIVFAAYRDNSKAIRTVVENFIKDTAVNVQIMELSAESVENHRILSSVLAGNEVAVDVLAVEDIWMKDFIAESYLRPIDDYVRIKKEEYPDRFSEIMYSGGRLYGIPLELDAGLMYYRSDLTDGKACFEDFLNISGGYALQGIDSEEMICVVLECVNLTGDTVKGLELYKNLVKGSVYTTANYMSDFRGGAAAYARAWTSDDMQVQSSFSKIRGKVQSAMLKKDDEPYATARAYCLAVNQNSEKDKENNIRKFLNYMLSESVQLELAKGRGTLPLKYKYYQNPIVRDYNDYNEDFEQYLNRLKYRAADKNYAQDSKIAREYIRDYIEGLKTVEETAAAVDKIVE